MIPAIQAISIFKRKNPHLTITNFAKYDNYSYILTAVKDPLETSYNTPFYLIDRESGKIENFDPLPNLSKMRIAFRDHKIDLS